MVTDVVTDIVTYMGAASRQESGVLSPSKSAAHYLCTHPPLNSLKLLEGGVFIRFVSLSS